MDVIDRQVDALQDFVILIGDGVGERNEFIVLDLIGHGWYRPV